MNVTKTPGFDPKTNEQKKMQEKAKRELDAIIQSWGESSEGIMHGKEPERINDHTPQEFTSFPSGGEEIEGSNCSSLKYLYENHTKQSTSSLNGDQVLKVASNSEVVRSNEELQFATELCHQVGGVLECATNHSSIGLKEDKKLLKGPKYKEMSASAASVRSVSNSVVEPVSTVSRNNSTVHSSVDQDDDTHNNPNNNQKKHICNLCKKRYKNLSHLTRHIKTAHNEKQVHLCNICNTSFTRSESLIRHLRLHEQHDATRTNKRSKQGLYKCPKCPKSYRQAYNVTRHLLSHSGVKPFKCTECDKSFTQYTGLSRHLVLHKGSRDFKCKDCGKSFARLFVLNRHMLTHSDDKPYKCFDCSKSFIRASQLSAHMNSHHKTRSK